MGAAPATATATSFVALTESTKFQYVLGADYAKGSSAVAAECWCCPTRSTAITAHPSLLTSLKCRIAWKPATAISV